MILHSVGKFLHALCQAEIEVDDDYFALTKCTCRQMRSWENCDFCFKLQFRLNHRIWKLCTDREKFENIFIFKALDNFLKALSVDPFFLFNNFRNQVVVKLDNPEHSPNLPLVVGKLFFIAEAESIKKGWRLDFSMKICPMDN